MSEWTPEPVNAPGSMSGRFVQAKNWLEVKEGGKLIQKFRCRILSKAVAGLVGWTADNKPIRARDMSMFPEGQKWREEKDPAGKMKVQLPKEFWAMAVWDYEGGQTVKVWEVPQRGIRDAISAAVKDKGSPFGYDLIVRRSGKGLDTTYTVSTADSAPMPPEAAAEWAALQAAGFDLDALFDGGDPFPAAAPAAPAPTGDGGRPNLPF